MPISDSKIYTLKLQPQYDSLSTARRQAVCICPSNNREKFAHLVLGSCGRNKFQTILAIDCFRTSDRFLFVCIIVLSRASQLTLNLHRCFIN